MTREEAKQRCGNLINAMSTNRFPMDRIECLLDGFIDLGMLKLDEPKSGEDQFTDAMQKHGYYHSVAEHTLDIIAKAGLKIVEK